MLRTTTGRVAAVQALIATAFVLLVGVIVNNETVGQFERETERSLKREFEQIDKLYNETGLRSVSQDVILRSTGQSPLLYVLASASGDVLVGDFINLPLRDITDTPRSDGFRAEIETAPGEFREARVKAYAGRLGIGGPILIIGQDMTAQDAAAGRILQQLFLVLSLGLLFALAAGLFAGWQSARRVEELSRTTRDVMNGDLGRRAQITSGDDEFNRLAREINLMLDQLQKLISYARSTGDAIAHDLRTPLTRLRSQLEMAIDQPPDSEADRAALVKTMQECDRLLNVFNAVLQIAQLETRSSWNFEVVDLSALAGEFVEFYEPMAEDAGLTISHAPTSRPVTARGDHRLLGQAMSNLIENAIKYTQPGGAILVEVRSRADGAVELLVEDNGPGIPPAQRARVIDRFARLEDHVDAAGAGLGLSLVAAVAKVHNGRFELRDGRHGGHPLGLGAALVLPSWGTAR